MESFHRGYFQYRLFNGVPELSSFNLQFPGLDYSPDCRIVDSLLPISGGHYESERAVSYARELNNGIGKQHEKALALHRRRN